MFENSIAEVSDYSAQKMLRRPSTTEQLLQKKQHLEKELEKVNAAIAFLEKNPEFANGLHLISIALG